MLLLAVVLVLLVECAKERRKLHVEMLVVEEREGRLRIGCWQRCPTRGLRGSDAASGVVIWRRRWLACGRQKRQ